MSRASRINERLLREPLFHFVLLAALLFLLEASFSGARKDTIVVDQQTTEYLIKQREDLELRRLNPDEQRETVASFVEDEILYREAYRRSLDKGDSRMRRNMIRKMRGLLAGEIEPPSDEVLRAYFEANRARFASPPTWSLAQVFFRDAGQVPPRLLDELRAGLDPQTVGEKTLFMADQLPDRSQREIALTFGPQVARAILDLEDSRWYGPFESPRGVHFVRVLGREPAQEASYESVRPYLEGEWTLAQSHKRIEQEIGRIRGRYEVIIEGAGEASR